MRRRAWLLFSFTLLTTGAAGAKTLLVGDSHTCGHFGANLAPELAPVVVYCAVSSHAGNWLNGTTPAGQSCFRMESPGFTKKPCGGDGRVPKLAAVLEREKPDAVVMALGTNSLGGASAGAENARLAELLRGRDCRWVGPPHLNPAEAKGFSSARLAQMDANVDGYYRSLGERLDGRCRLVDSRPSTRPGQPGHRTTDGVHRGQNGGRAWALDIAARLRAAAAAPETAATGRP